MLNPTEHFDSFFRQVTNTLPKGLFSLHKDLEKNLRVAMESAFHRMNLVTREEFDVQAAVLARTREKLESLETLVATLEAKQQTTNTTSATVPEENSEEKKILDAHP